MKTKQNKYFIYARKSTDEKSDKQLQSIESQIDVLKDLAAKEGLQVVEILTESRSAKESGRPIFADMLTRIRKGEASGIIVWKLDRLARNMPEGSQIIDLLQKGIIKHIRSACDGHCHPDDNVIMLCMHFGMANQYSRDLAKNVTRGLKSKCEKGWLPTQPPSGYLNSRSKSKGEETIIIDPELFPIVRKIWDKMLEGALNPTQILKVANDEWGLRVKSKKAYNKMSRSGMYKILNSTFYYGKFEYPQGSGNWYTGKHEPMITQAEFEQVQDMLHRKDRPRSQNHQLTFTGSMTCGECGKAITGEDKVKRPKNGKVHYYTYYHCTKHGTQCSQGSVEEKQLVQQIETEIASLEIPESFHLWSIKWIKEEIKNDTTSQAHVIESQQKAYNAAVIKIQRLIDMCANGVITEDELASRKHEAIKEKDRLQRAISKLPRAYATGLSGGSPCLP
jgi:site-specific DNA recombinase